jgi:hypothetical protein
MLEAATSGSETIELPWIVLLAFMRLTTRRGAFLKPIAVEQAFDRAGT